MFDDPKKDLKRLEQQLLAEEAKEDPAEDLFEEEEDWLDVQLREAHALLDGPAVRRSEPEDVFRFLEEDVQENTAAVSGKSRPASPKEERKKRKEKGVGGLVFLACLETLGIIAVLLWWATWLL